LEKLDTETTSIDWNFLSLKFTYKLDILNCKVCYELHHKNNKCEKCDEKKEVWLCMICGYSGCGRYENKHAIQHF